MAKITKTIDLRSPDLRKAVVGTTVITSKGFKFKLVSRKKDKESWKDLTSNLTWHDVEDKNYDPPKTSKMGHNQRHRIREFFFRRNSTIRSS